MPPKRRKVGRPVKTTTKKSKVAPEEAVEAVESVESADVTVTDPQPEESKGEGPQEKEPRTEESKAEPHPPTELQVEEPKVENSQAEKTHLPDSLVSIKDTQVSNFRFLLPRNILESLPAELPCIDHSSSTSVELSAVSDDVINGSLTINGSVEEIVKCAKFLTEFDAEIPPDNSKSLSIVVNKSAVMALVHQELPTTWSVLPGTCDFCISIKIQDPESGSALEQLATILLGIVENSADLRATEGDLYSNTSVKILFENKYGKHPVEQKVNVELKKFYEREARAASVAGVGAVSKDHSGDISISTSIGTTGIGGSAIGGTAGLGSGSMEERAGLPTNGTADLSTENGLFQARNLVNHLASKRQPAAHTLYVRVKVPTHVVGSIIGKGGARILEMKKTCGAFFRFDDRHSTEPLQTMTISGTADQVKVGISLVYKRIESEMELRRR